MHERAREVVQPLTLSHIQEAELAWRDVKPKMEKYDGDFKVPIHLPRRKKGRPPKHQGYDPYFDDLDPNYR